MAVSGLQQLDKDSPGVRTVPQLQLHVGRGADATEMSDILKNDKIMSYTAAGPEYYVPQDDGISHSGV